MTHKPAPLHDPAFEARIAAYDASEAFQAEPSIDTARAVLVAIHKAPEVEARIPYAARKARAWMSCAEGQGAA